MCAITTRRNARPARSKRADASPAVAPTVFVADSDPRTRHDIAALAQAMSLSVEVFATFDLLLQALPHNAHGCLVLDDAQPNGNGVQLLRCLRDRGVALPAILVCDCGDVESAVEAMKHGAVDFLQKPLRRSALMASISQAIERDRANWKLRQQQAEVDARLAELTHRQRQVLRYVLQGLPSKVIAAQLGIRQKTVEAHRSAIMIKFEVANVAELICRVLSAPAAAHAGSDELAPLG